MLMLMCTLASWLSVRIEPSVYKVLYFHSLYNSIHFILSLDGARLGFFFVLCLFQNEIRAHAFVQQLRYIDRDICCWFHFSFLLLYFEYYKLFFYFVSRMVFVDLTFRLLYRNVISVHTIVIQPLHTIFRSLKNCSNRASTLYVEARLDFITISAPTIMHICISCNRNILFNALTFSKRTFSRSRSVYGVVHTQCASMPVCHAI